MADSNDVRPRNASVFPILEAAIAQTEELLANDESASLGDEGVIFPLFLSGGEITTTTRYWIGGTGFWDVASNWTGNVLPSLTDDVIIDVAGDITTTHRSGNTQINSLLSEEAFVLSGGTITVTEDVSLNSSYTLSGGTLTAGGTVLLAGNGSWYEGTMAATEGITNTGSLAIGWYQYDDYKYLEGNLINKGTITHNAYYGGTSDYRSAQLLLKNLSKVNNQNGATYEFQEGEILAASGATDTAFNNFGNLRKTTANTARIAVAFNNSGQVNVEQGTLYLGGGGVSSNGIYNIASGAYLDFTGGNHSLKDSTQVKGSGTVGISSDTVNFKVSEGTTIEPTVNLSVTTGTASFDDDATLGKYYLNGSGKIGVTGSLSLGNGSWYEGTMAATKGITNTGSLAIGWYQYDDYKYLEGNLINKGTITYNAYYGGTSDYRSAQLLLKNLSKVNNQNGATYELQRGEILAASGATDTVFNNFGNLRKTTANTARIAVAFNNSGQVNVEQGNLSFSNTYIQTAGSTNLNGGSLSTSNPLNIQGGSLAGFGNVNGSVTNAGLINPTSFGDVIIINGELINPTSLSSGSIGSLNISGNYTETSTANMNFELGGDENTGLFDKLNIGGLATFAGTLNVSLVNGFVPQIGDRIKIITFNKYTGTLNFTGLNIGGGLQLTPLFIDGDNNGFADNLTLVVGTNQPPVANPDVVFANENTGTIFNVAILLSNDTDPENDTLRECL
jgi:hypothetical protein